MKDTDNRISAPKTRLQNPPYILALDLGTSSVRAILFDRLGLPVAGLMTQREIQTRTDLDGTVEVDAETILSTLFECIDALLAKINDRISSVRGVSMCTFVSNVLGLGGDDRPLTPVYIYADTRPAQDVQRLRQHVDEETIHPRTGVHFHSSYLPARFLWLERTDPHRFNQVKKWVSLGEYLLLKLFGDTAISYSAASWTGLLNYRTLCWDEQILSVLPVQKHQLSRLIDIDESFSGLRGEYAQRWTLLQHIPWFPAIGDGAAANIGSGCTRQDRLTISIGTSSAVRMVLPSPPESLPKGLWCYRVDRRRALLGGAMSEGGSIYGWLRHILNLGDELNIDDKLLHAPTGGHGLSFLPLITGERSPGWIPEARGAISGLSIANTPLDILQAGMEGVCCRIALVYNLLRTAHPQEAEIVASGGAVQSSKAWQTMLANALGKPIRLSSVPEATARGSALLALEALGILPDAGDAPDFLSDPLNPDMQRYAVFCQLLEKQKTLYDCVIGRAD